jgi:Uma2 family endonuclease
VLNPTVLIEVQSPSTESDDRGPKLDCYKLISSVQAVLLVAQDESRVDVHARLPDGSWHQREYVDGILEVPGIDCRLPISEIYEDLP